MDTAGARNAEPNDWEALRTLVGVPGVPALFGTGTHADAQRQRKSHYVTCMALLGESLHAARHRRPFSVAEVAQIAVEALHTLRCAHARGLLHRDVKPENLLFGRHGTAGAGRIHFCDWGLAGSSERTYRTANPGSVTGTPGFASINSMLGRAPAPRDDLEGLVYCLSFALAGRMPWQTPKAIEDSKQNRAMNVRLARSMADATAQVLFPQPAHRAFRSFANAVFALPFDGEVPYAALSGLFADGKPELPSALARPVTGRCGTPSVGWTLLFRAGDSMRQRYHSHVTGCSVEKHALKAWDDGLWFGCAVATCPAPGAQAVYSFTCEEHFQWGLQDAALESQAMCLAQCEGLAHRMPTDWVAARWAEGMVITCVAGDERGETLCVMSKLAGSGTWDQRYKLHPQYPHEWIQEKLGHGFAVTTLVALGSSYLVVVSKSARRSVRQAFELDFCYPSEPIHRLWDQGYRMQSITASPDAVATVMEQGGPVGAESTERLPRTDFPADVVKRHWGESSYLRYMTYGRINC